MSFFNIFVLGLVQGVAEFLPISSSGHLVIVEQLLGIQQDNILFEVFLHFSTLLTVIIYFRQDIFKLKKNQLKLIVIATVPIVIVGLMFKDLVQLLFSSITLVASFLVITGILNLVTARQLKRQAGSKKKKQISTKQAVVIGVFQALAILPGISRSGSTVFAGITQGVDRVKTFRFSFLLVIPAILGASLLELLGNYSQLSEVNLMMFLVGGVTAFVSGLLSLKLFEYVIKTVQFSWFGYYSLTIGSLILLMVFI